MRSGWSILLSIIIGFFCLSLGDPTRPNGISWNEAFPFSVEDERELGEKVSQDIRRRMEIIQAPPIQGYVDNLGRRIVSSADPSEFPIRFFVIKESEPNAFAIPGGTIFVTSGLIRLVESEDELAGVMGHEVAHVVRRHIAQSIEASKRMNIATLAGILAGIFVGGSGGGAIMAGSLAMGVSQQLKYSREHESEADRLGLAYTTRAGYAPNGITSFLKKISRRPQYNAAFPTYLATHPGVPTRISYIETLMAGLPDSTPSGTSPDALRGIQLRLFIFEEGPLESLDYFNSLLKTRPHDSAALLGRALAEKEMGRIRESIEDLKTAHALKPGDPQILKELGFAFIRFGRTNAGVRALERSLSLSEKDAETLDYLGQGYQAQKRLDLAIETYLKAKELSPDLPELDRTLGSAYREKGEMGRFHFYYGLYFKKKGELKYARFHFEKASELSGVDAQAQEEALRELGQLKK